MVSVNSVRRVHRSRDLELYAFYVIVFWW